MREGSSATDFPRRVGDYEILGELGRGGMGVVYRARHGRLGRFVALKMLRGGSFEDGSQRERFLWEAAAVTRLQHPLIVQLYEIGEYVSESGERHPYFTLELVEGGNLADRLANRPPTPQQAAAWVEQVARAVHYAHQRGLVHRDLKPSNILLTPDGQPRLCDFGIAKALEGDGIKTRSGLLVGTPEYMAPEQLDGSGRIGPLVDVYALGAVLYALLVGRPPFRAASVAETLSLICTADPEPPRRWQSSIPVDLDTICLKCLNKELPRRYPSAEALADDLARFLRGQPIVARPVGPLGRAAKWARRRPATAGLLAAVVLLTAVGIALVVGLWRGAQAQAEVEHRANTLAQEKVAEQTQSRGRVARLLANTILDHGLNLCAQGEVDQGLLHLARALEIAAEFDDAALERVARANLAAWRHRLITRLAALYHADWVWAVAFSPDGRTALTGGKDGLAKRWDARTGQLLGQPLRHRYPVWAVTFSPDGRIILTGSGDDSKPKPNGEVQLWDAATGQPLGPSLPLSDEVRTAVFSPDGRKLLAVCDDEVRVWETAHVLGQQRSAGLLLPHSQPAQRLPRIQPRLWAVFSPDGNTILTGGEDGTARLWDAETGTPRGDPLRHDGPVLALAFSPDGRTIVTGSYDGTARLWDAATGRPRGQPLPHPGRVNAIAFTSDGQLLATGCAVEETDPRTKQRIFLGGEARLWRTATGERIGEPMPHPQSVWAVAFRPGSRLLLTGARDKTARFFGPGGVLLGKPLAHEGTVPHVVFSPDGRLALTASAGGDRSAHARLWELPAEGKQDELVSFERIGRAGEFPVDFTPDARGVLTIEAAGNTARVYDLATGRQIGPPLIHSHRLHTGTFSRDGRTLVTITHDRMAHIWDWPSGRRRGKCHSVAQTLPAVVRTDSETVMLAFRDQAEVWDIASGKSSGPTRTQWVGFTNLAAVSPDGRIIYSREAGQVRQWEARTGKDLGVYPALYPVHAIAFAGERPIGITSEQHQLTRLWDLASGRLLGAPLAEPTGLIGDLAFTTDEQSILVGSWDHKAARLWDTATGKPIGPPLVHADSVNLVRFTSDERRMLSCSMDGKVHSVSVPRPLDGTPQRLRCWVEVLTGMQLDEQGTSRNLGAKELRERRQLLHDLGGPPDGADHP